MKKLILTALDNNDEIWYRCFIPFILSLRQTNYSYDIGVISYQLSLEKQEILKSNGIIIFESENKFPEILVDRHYTASIISQDYDYLAFYDADIWFSYKELTVFEQLKDNKSLYCCYDVIHPPFLLQPLPDNRFEATQQKFQALIEVQQYFWQVGLIAGSKQAWENYRHYIEHDLFSLSEFRMQYGIDTTILNLYSCDTKQVKHISEKYNCLPYWGIQLTTENYFSLNNQPVEAVHITRYHRESKEYNYIQLNQLNYLNDGAKFSLLRSKILYYSNCGHLFSSLPQKENNAPLFIEQLSCSYLSANIDLEGVFYQKDDLIIDLSSDSEIFLKNSSSQTINMIFSFQEKLNTRLPCYMYFELNEEKLNLERNISYSLIINPYSYVKLTTSDLWSNGTGIRYIFRGIRIS